MVDWDSSKKAIPAELKMLFRFEGEKQSYAVIHSCHNKCTSLSVLSKIWIKEYEKDTTVSIKKLEPYADNDSTKGRLPTLRIILCEAIQSHCLLMPLHDTSQQVIQIK